MPAWTLALLLIPPSAIPDYRKTAISQTISLYRGAPLAGQPIRYWSVEDTVLDPAKQDGSFGGESYLGAAPGKVVLIRFGDLRRALGPNKRITKASIYLSITGGNPVPLDHVSEVLVPWGEGPTQVVTYGGTPPSVAAPNLAATWKNRRSGLDAIPWQQPGASGVGDAKPIAGAKASSPDNDHVRIEGLAAAMQRQYDRPYDFHGFALSFTGLIEFASSQHKSGRPVLELECETTEPPRGPDLAVVRISRTPEYPRYSEPAHPAKVTQDGLEVALPSPPANWSEKHWPANGEEVTYKAVIKNLGDAPSSGYLARWVQKERTGSSVESDKVLAPGEETTLTLTAPYKPQHLDHRLQSLALKIEPKGPDSNPANNALEIQESALSVGISLSPDVAQAVGGAGFLEETTPQGLAQAVVHLWNEVIFPQSRFSFAPDGVLERMRLQRLDIGERVDDSNLDVSIRIESASELSDPAKMFMSIGRQLGLSDLSLASFSADSHVVSIGSSVLERGSSDLYPGLMGGGDTRNESFVPNMLPLPFEPAYNDIFTVLPIEATDLLSATDVAALNGAIGHRRGFIPEGLYNLPATLLVRIVDQAGHPVQNATVEVYQMAGGVVRASQPIATLGTGAAGNIILSARQTPLPDNYKTPLGQVLRPNPFGAIDPTGTNGLLLLKISSGGNTDYAYLKAWQVVDSYRRNPSPALVLDVRVNIGGDVDRTQNLAKNRIVTDSTNMLPAKLVALVDDSNSTGVEFASGKDSWVEVDLGRDRAFGEISLVPKGPFWEQFSIVAYATGQTASEAKTMTRETSWSWAISNRPNTETSGDKSVSYKTSGIRARYLRIIRLTDGPPGGLAELRVHPLRGP